MVSESKRKKQKHGNMWPGSLKNKDLRLKKFLFFTSSQRKKNNKIDDEH